MFKSWDYSLFVLILVFQGLISETRFNKFRVDLPWDRKLWIFSFTTAEDWWFFLQTMIYCANSNMAFGPTEHDMHLLIWLIQ